MNKQEMKQPAKVPENVARFRTILEKMMQQPDRAGEMLPTLSAIKLNGERPLVRDETVDAADRMKLTDKRVAAVLYNEAGFFTMAAKLFMETGQPEKAEEIAKMLAEKKAYAQSILIYEMLGMGGRAEEVRRLQHAENRGKPQEAPALWSHVTGGAYDSVPKRI